MGPRERELHLRYDGAIPGGELKLAQILDRSEAASRRANEAAAHCRIGERRLKPAGIVAVMADHMLQIRALHGACEQQHLTALGWTPAECAVYGERAAAIAAERAGLRLAISAEA